MPGEIISWLDSAFTRIPQGLRIKYEQSYSIVVRVFHYSTRLLIA